MIIKNKYCKKIENFYNDLYPNRKKLAYVRTYGCQQNVSDSEKYIGMLLKMGFEITDVPDNADVILLNTCAIRENAENKVFGNIGWIKNIKKNNKNLFVIVCGCMTEQEVIIKKIKSTYSFINLVLGTHSIYKFPELFYSSLVKESKNPIFSGDKEDSILEGFPEYKNNKLKAFLSVMYGCNNYCSYCIVPYVRGRERSRKPEQIVSEFKKLLDAGYKDITLLGQNVNSYGKNLEESVDFSDLLKMLDNFDGEYTIRFMTSHPKDASNKLIDTIAASKHIAHHLHLPVQCGSNHILSEMNRKYTKESYMKIIEYARHKIPDIIFTSDIIVGFPGETYEEFLDTIKAIDEFCSDIDEFEKKFKEGPDYLITKIQKYIIKSWYDAVNEHYNNNPVMPEERTQLTDDELAAIKTESIYGSTLIIAVLTENLCFGMQLGDGSLVVIKQCGESYMPIIDDESCPANLTASLCNSNAIKMFGYFYTYDRPLTMIVSTDGLFTSFSSKESFEEYNCLIASQLDDPELLKSRMNKNFVRRTNSGSRDDISIAMIFEKEMFDENYINVQMQVDINKNKAAIREAEEKAKQLKRKARVEQIRYEKRMMEEAEKRMLAQKAKLKEEMESLEVETPDETNTENDTSSENVSE